MRVLRVSIGVVAHEMGALRRARRPWTAVTTWRPLLLAFAALIPIAVPNLAAQMDFSTYAIFSALSMLNWQYLLAGFLLFRFFDIWKPYPIRSLEKWRGGWGIMRSSIASAASRAPRPNERRACTRRRGSAFGVPIFAR